MICIMVQNGEAFIWILGFALKSVGVVITRLIDSSLKQDEKEGPWRLGSLDWYTEVIKVSSGYFLALGQMTYSHCQNRFFVFL